MNLLKIVVVVALVSIAPNTVLAACASYDPVPTLVLNSSKTIPANVGGIPFFGTSGEFDIELLEGESVIPVEFSLADSLNIDVKVAKPTGWAEGKSYRVVLKDGETIVIDETITVVGAFVLTGTPVLSVVYENQDEQGVDIIAAKIVMTGVAELSEVNASPYLNFETLIDGELRSEFSTCSAGPRPVVTAFGPGVDYLVASCEPNVWIEDFMDSGTYNVGMRVSIIGDNSLDLAPAISVDLCDPQNANNGNTNGGTTNDMTGQPIDESGNADSSDDGGCSSTSGNFGVVAFIGLIGLIRRRL